MSSAAAKRRSRSHIETDAEADAIRFADRSFPVSPSSNGSKRMRLRGGRGAPSQLEESEDEHDQGSDADYYSFPGADSDALPPRRNGDVTSNGIVKAEFSTGAIVRVMVENFVTYEKAEFSPGPNLNMVIGPNGTGKSSLVCAICLGLGYPASVLGRATSFGEFVKHGKEYAIVEVELQKRPEDRANYIIRLKINREDNNRKFSLNGKEITHKRIQHLMQMLRIQIDNLCQFLPQDKVAEFAGLNSIDLLTKTLQAAAPQEVIDQQQELRKMFDEQKEVQRQLAIDAETLRGWETRQQGLQADVERLREREEIQKMVADLTDARLVLVYNEKKDRFNAVRERRKQAAARHRRLEESSAPSLQDVNLKQAYQSKVQVVFHSRKRRAKEAEQDAERDFARVLKIDDDIKNIEDKKAAEQNSLATKRQEISGFRARITNLEARYKGKCVDFSAADWNHKIREQKARLDQEVRDERQELDAMKDELNTRAKTNRIERESAVNELGNLTSQEGQRFLQLRNVDTDVASAWKWLQDNESKFEKPVFGPAMLTCSMKDKRYSDQVQSLLQRDDLLCFTAQTRNDHKKLTDRFFRDMKLAVTVRTVTANLSSFRSPIPQEQLHSMGFDGYALDFLEGPDPVLAMLCSEKRIHLTGVALNDVSDEQYQKINDGQVINSFACGNSMYRITRRKEYGPGATSTMSRTIQPGRFWKDEPLDTAAKSELEQRIQEYDRDYVEMKQQNDEISTKRKALNEKVGEIQEELTRLESEKATLQREYNQWKFLPDKIESEKSNLQNRLDDMRETKQRLLLYDNEYDKLTIEKAEAVLQHKERLCVLRDANQAVIEAAVRLIEADSDLAALKERNAGIVQKLEKEKNLVDELVHEAELAKAEAKEAQEAFKAVISTGVGEELDTDRRDFLIGLSEGHTVANIDADIETENAKLDLIHAADPGVLQEFEKRARDIERSQREKARKEQQLEELSTGIQALRGEWEPRLDEIIRQINDAFSYNFEQINCAGEVGVHKDEDFDKWAIEIKVKFRENETLQKLDQHRQSGGERAVSTIFYLMSLQSMAQSPFRVVDEINQGMDPRNERMVHERMVEIACNEHTSQYFLITPKLLSGLRYDERMKVLCIASGEHMPEEGGKLDFSRCVKVKKMLLAATAAS
ncbi:Structural maintenance of chromosomes protein 5 [Cytospora mali]|uniref:Structural maintenance of chromosomes protein 5 n=1 Tax=Cytospora mali TaxID=578113 RepID=A0A194WDP1_CYTMA|nr:Structural maintenance of chromosomes protein 5 [Valsa mali]